MRYAYNNLHGMLCPDHTEGVRYVLLDMDECEEAGKDPRYGEWALDTTTGTIVDMYDTPHFGHVAWTIVDTANDRNALAYGDAPDDRCAAADCLR